MNRPYNYVHLKSEETKTTWQYLSVQYCQTCQVSLLCVDAPRYFSLFLLVNGQRRWILMGLGGKTILRENRITRRKISPSATSSQISHRHHTRASEGISRQLITCTTTRTSRVKLTWLKHKNSVPTAQKTRDVYITRAEVLNTISCLLWES
jgi:hypothetical protein